MSFTNDKLVYSHVQGDQLSMAACFWFLLKYGHVYLVGLYVRIIRELQGDQLNVALCFWYLLKSDFSGVYAMYNRATGQVTFYKVPEKHCHVCLVGLYVRIIRELQDDQLNVALCFWYLLKHGNFYLAGLYNVHMLD